MEENKLLNQIKSAAENAETKEFPGMENVWQRVEGKLDTKADKKAISRWRKIAVAASVLLFATLGYQFLNNDPKVIKSNEVVTANDTMVKTAPQNAVATSGAVNPVIKKDAEQILQKQILSAPQVALVEEIKNEEVIEAAPEKTEAEVAKYSFGSDEVEAKRNSGMMNSVSSNGYVNAGSPMMSFKRAESKEKSVEMFMDKSNKVSKDKKEAPLVVIEDRIIKQKLETIEFEDTDSLVVLKEPLYIINGVEYTEQEVFGPNPTSPYTPLNKQDIESVSILQNEKAVEVYGDKGKKGVVIITTKTRKPVSASKKAK